MFLWVLKERNTSRCSENIKNKELRLLFFLGDLWYNTYNYDYREARIMTIAKVLFAVLVCVPLAALAGWIFSRLVDDVARKRQ